MNPLPKIAQLARSEPQMALNLCSEYRHKDTLEDGARGTPQGPPGSFRKGSDSHASQEVERPPARCGRSSLFPAPSAPSQILSCLISVLKPTGNICSSPAVRLGWCWLRRYSLDMSPRADSRAARVDNGFQQVGHRSGLM